MTQCLNPNCLESNPPETKFCQSCNEKLVLVERYRALKIIGRGGFGRTFQAVDEFKPSKPFCVIKQFLPQSQKTENLSKAALLFAQEAERLDTLGRHPQIPELLAYFTQDNRQYLVQEFIDGQNLQQELKESGAFNERQILELLKSLLPVLEFIHSQQVIHRDIKPENIIRRKNNNQLYPVRARSSPENNIILVDFGIAKFVTKKALAVTGTIIGSEGYAPPEQAIGKATFSSDIYSLGVTCIHLLTEVEPFKLFDVGEGEWIWRKYLKSKVSDQVGNLLDKMIVRATNKRFQNPGEILSLINQTYPTEKKFTPPPQISQKSTAPPIINETSPPQTFLRSEIGEIFTFEVVAVNNFGKIINRTPGNARQKIEDLGNGIKLEMVYIPGGSFLMGSPEKEVERLNSESPQHQVTLQPFYMSKYPITQNQYQAIMGENPSNFKGGNRPVEKATWHNATEFCQRLSEKTGKIYRLPSESQWEYACRAGTTTPFYFGETITSELVNYNGNYIYGKAPKDKYRGETTNVGSFPPNSFGLYDMHGNVWEWCLDIWHINYDGAPNDGSAWETAGNSNIKVLRGGSWSNSSWNCRSARRYDNYSNNLIYCKGFRIVWYTSEVRNSLDKMIVGKTNKKFQNTGEISSLINQTYPTEKKLTPPPQKSQNLTVPPIINETSPPQKFLKSIPESEIGEIFTFEVVTVNNFGKIINRTPGSARQKIEDLGNGIKLEMVYIPGGSFLMGSPENKPRKYDIESPPHQVTIQPFYISKYPITQNQYQAIMGENSSNFTGKSRPVENVTWYNATEFCQRLSEKTGKIYKLPSESQWEYSCRAGTTTPFYFGETITSELANYNGNYIYGKAPKSNYLQETTNVGIFPPNAFGLYDMHGNVWEWCLDIWHDNYNDAPNDGSVWERGENSNQRIIRGGSWNNNPNHCRSAFRFNNYVDNCIMNLGFRVLLLPNFQKKFQNTEEILSVINQTYPTEKKFTPPLQISQKLTAPPIINETSPPETFPESIPESEIGEIFTFEVVTVNNSGKIINRTPRNARQKIEDLGNGIKLEMVYIPGGSFLMGSPENEERRFNTESPPHQVTIQPFYMSKYPITQEQYQIIMDKNPSHFKGRNRPVETVTWYNATEFCQKLSQKTTKTYSLPSESQWEYACRAGTTTPFYFGETITSELVNYNGNYTYRDAPKGKYQEQTTNVGSFPPNAFGLYDMHGNVCEWCQDIWHDNYQGAPNDGSAWQDRDIDSSPMRGGSWYDNPEFCRSAIRVSYFGRVFRYNYFGFRIVCSPNSF
ncbi:bifunctional serine/threonine-protein kinase/formylglycine-generating enzyme family protein [Okeania sp. SIO2B3]|uniref:bifunctional serine/threonine-protein kinase/formylglycine-generating enzyme family protein n=1 Tax=Okeania sp. SIO2B3 TaxID=2607784 RepID=UPI0025EE4AB8|nr:bifunctional serine/threonine-protein kinase/formylglycine-generating enzyme family protein [Okeania sp. SIO2B3]